MMKLNDLKQQVELFHRIPAEKRLEREEIRIKLIKETGVYFREKFIETTGLLTPELISEIDSVYDVPGQPGAIAEALGVTINHVKGFLSKDRVITCAGGCGKSLTIKVQRRLGGYTTLSDWAMLCKKCQQKRQQGRDQTERRQSEILHEEMNQWLEMDNWLSITDQPLDSPLYRDHLYWYYVSWIKGDWPYYFFSSDSSGINTELVDAPGCMICGSCHLSLYLIEKKLIPPGSDFYRIVSHLYRHSRHYHEAWDSRKPEGVLKTYSQALWTLGPGQYFSNNLGYPLLERPLLILCPECGTLAEANHRVIEFENPLRLLSYEAALLNLNQLMPTASEWLYLIYGSNLTQSTNPFVKSMLEAYGQSTFHLYWPDVELDVSQIENEQYQKALKAGLLVISGLDQYISTVEYRWKWKELIFLINERIQQRRPLIFANNCDMSDLKQILDEAESDHARTLRDWFETYICRQIFLQKRSIVVEESCFPEFN